MTRSRSIALLVASTVVLAAVVLGWVLRDDGTGRADLEVVAPLAATSTSSSTSTTTVPASSAPAPAPPTTVPPPPPPAGIPVRVRVPSIGVDASIVSVGLRLDGQMEVPGAADVGWYRLGPAPGAGGSAVLAAHVDYRGQRGAFFDLRSVPVGAEVQVDIDGTTRRFVVSNREQFPKQGAPLERYFTAEGPARLTLITCGGAFDRGARHYSDNIVLTADLVG